MGLGSCLHPTPTGFLGFSFCGQAPAVVRLPGWFSLPQKELIVLSLMGLGHPWSRPSRKEGKQAPGVALCSRLCSYKVFLQLRDTPQGQPVCSGLCFLRPPRGP